MTQPLRLAFMGTPPFGRAAFDALRSVGHDIVALYSQPPRPSGRGHQLQKSAMHLAAEAAGIPVRTPVTLRKAEEQQAFAALNLDAAVVVAYGLILPRPILDAPRLGCVNIHASALPRWRGAAPIQRALLAGDRESAVMTMLMDEGLDTGPVLLDERIAIPPGLDSAGLHDAMSAAGGRLIVPTLEGLASGRLIPRPQSSEGITYAAKIGKDEPRINWNESAAQCANRVRAFAPAPGAWAMLDGERVKILKAVAVSGSGAPGAWLGPGLTIACGDGALRLDTVQRAGRTPVSGEEFLRAVPDPAGLCFA